MNRFYKELDADDRRYVKSVTEAYHRKGKFYLLDERTVVEQISRVLLKTSECKERRVSSVLDREIVDALSDSLNIVFSRNKRKLGSSSLTVYKGLVTTSLLADTEESNVKSVEKIEWVGDSRRLVKWKDIVILSAIYDAVGYKVENTGNPDRVDIKASDVFSHIYPVYYDEETIGEFIGILNETVWKFQTLSGLYTDGKKEYPISSDFFLGIGGQFDDRGMATYSKSDYQKTCEDKNRLVSVNHRYLRCDSIDEAYRLSYLVYRYRTVEADTKDRQKPCIYFDTMRKAFGETEGDFSQEEMPYSMRKWTNMLKPLFRGRKIEWNRITWKKENGK